MDAPVGVCDASSMVYDVNIELEETAEHTPPVPYNRYIETNSKLARMVFYDGFRKGPLNKRLVEFYSMRTIGLFTIDVKPEIAEAKIKELIQIYLYLQRKTGDHKIFLGLLKIAMEISIKYKIPNDAYVR